MDIVKANKSKDKLGKTQLRILSSVAVIMLVSWYAFSSSNTPKTSKNNITISEVKYGDLQLTISGFGYLKSNKQTLLSAFSRGTVEEIVLKPGAEVTPESVIIKLFNPELTQEHQNAYQALVQQKAVLRQLQLNNQRDLLAEADALAEIKSEYEITRLLRIAESKIAEEGIVTALTLKRTELNEKQLHERMELRKKRYEQLKDIHKESVAMQQEIIKQHEGLLSIAQNRIDRLTVKSNISGVLQRLPVELGQSVNAGEQLAVVGSTQDLVAMLRIPQSQISDINLGQSTIVNTHQHQIPGVVSRIDPTVVEGTVTVEVALTPPLPESARPDLNVDGRIITQTLKNAHYIKRPVNAKDFSALAMFKMNDSSNATRTQVEFGKGTDRFIQIINGATKSESFIISDMSEFSDAEHLSVTD